MKTPWVIVPCKGYVPGKSRLASALGNAGREALNRRLLLNMLDAIREWHGNLARCVVVSPCPRALADAQAAGAVSLRDPSSPGGLNAALEAGAALARARGACKLLVLPCDLPHATAQALERMAHVGASRSTVVIAPDRRGDGTNALLVDAGAPFRFQFGAASYASHIAEARRMGARFEPHADPALAFDLDEACDLAEAFGDVIVQTKAVA